MSRPTHQSCRGFTLVEVLIAFTLLVLIVTLGYSALHFAGRSWQSLDRISERIENQRQIAQFLSRQLERAVPLVIETNGERRIVFKGEQNELTWVSRLPAHRGGGLHLLWLSLEDGRLLFDYRPLYDAASVESSFDGSNSRVLLGDISELAFAYYGNDSDNIPADWHNHWTSSYRLPKLVRLTIRPAQDQPWPDLITAFRAQVLTGRPELVIHSDRLPVL